MVEDQDSICLQYGVNAVSNGEDGAVLEGFSDGYLDQKVGLCINRCRGLIQENNLMAREVNRQVNRELSSQTGEQTN